MSDNSICKDCDFSDNKNNKDKFINLTNAYKIILESLTKPAKT